jgi:U4/U6.U5 tri-snRNP component SNU23
MAADGKEAAGSKNFVRRTWDTEEYEKKASDRAVKEAEGDETGIIGPDGKRAPAPYKDAPEGVAGPEGSKRAYLQRRDEDLNLEARLGKKQLVTDSTPLSEAGGYWCDLCQCTLKDSATYLDHRNGKKRTFNDSVCNISLYTSLLIVCFVLQIKGG